MLLFTLLAVTGSVSLQAQFATIDGTYPVGGVSSFSANTYQLYTFDVTAAASSSYLSFLMQNNPGYTNLDTIAVSLQGSATNLLLNGGLDTGTGNTPTDWTLIGTAGLSFPGTWSAVNPQAGAGNWRDGAIGGTDGITQSIATTIGSIYTVSFYLRNTNPFASNNFVNVYFGALPGGLVGGPALPATHWLGQTGGANLWSAANWASDATGTTTTATPTATDDITFTATGSSGQRTTTLDQNFTIKSLTVNTATGVYATGGFKTINVVNNTNVNALLSLNARATLYATNGGGQINVSAAGVLAGDDGVIQIDPNNTNPLNMLGSIYIGDPGNETAATQLTVRAYGAPVNFGPAAALVVDIYSGDGLGDNTGDPLSADRIVLEGTLNASATSTLIINNPNGLSGWKGGDEWLLVDMDNKIPGTLNGDPLLDDSALNLKSTQTGNFDKTTGIYKIIETESGLQIAVAQDQGIMSGVQGILGDINGRLFNLRAGWGEEPQGSISDSLGGDVDQGVTLGEGDGPEDPIAKRIPRTRQWEVFTTVNYANISISSIRSQAGVDSQTWAPGLGIERHFTRHLTIGFAANLLETQQTYANGLGNMDMQGIALSAYASYVRRSLWVDLLYSWGAFDLETDRNSTGFPVANGETNAYTNAVQFNGGWSFRVPAWKLVHGPLAGVDWLHVNIDGYSETGGGLGALSYASRSVDSLITRVGWSVTKEFDTSFAKITPQLRLTYERQNIDRNNGTSVNLINQPFTATTNSESPGQSYMVAGAGVNFEFTQDFSMLLTYQGQFFREDMQAHYGTVRFTYKF